MFVGECSPSTPRHLDKTRQQTYTRISMHAYYAAFALYSAVSWIDATVFCLSEFPAGALIEGAIQAVTLFLLMLTYFFRTTSRLRQIISALLVILGFAVWRISQEGWLFWTCLFVLCAPEFDCKKLSKIVVYTIGAVLVLSTLSVAAGLFPAQVMVRLDNGVSRNALGFLHPNSLGLAFSVLAIAISVQHFNEFRILYIPVYLCAAVFVYLIPVSRTSAISIVLDLAAWIIASEAEKKGHRNLVLVILCVVFLLSASLSLLLMFLYDDSGSFTVLMNKVLSGRPFFAKQYFDASGIRLLGYSFADGPTLISDGESVRFLVDNAFDHVLLRYGVIPFSLLFGSVAILFAKAFFNKVDLSLICGLSMFMLMGVTESFACRVDCNYLLISLAFIFGESISKLCSSDGQAPSSIAGKIKQ